MRFVFLMFGGAGFLLVALAGWSASRTPELVLRDAAVGCLVAAVVGRWFWSVLQHAVAQTAAARRAVADAAAAAEAEANKGKADARLASAQAALSPKPATAASASPAPGARRPTPPPASTVAAAR